MDASEIQQTVKMALIAITLDAFSSPVNTHLVIMAYALYRWKFNSAPCEL